MVRHFIGILILIFINVQTSSALETKMIWVSKDALLHGEVIASHTTTADAPMFPNTAVVLRHKELGIVHCNIAVHLEKDGLVRDVACATFK